MRIPEMRNPAVDSDRVRKVCFIQNKIPVSTLSLPRKEEWESGVRQSDGSDGMNGSSVGSNCHVPGTKN